MNLHTARVFVHHLADARLFYTQQLGLPLTVDGLALGYCVFKAGATELVVEHVPADAPADDRALVGRFTGLSFTVADAQATCTELQTRGVVFTQPPEQQPWGGILATFRDPAGNLLQIVQPPHAV